MYTCIVGADCTEDRRTLEEGCQEEEEESPDSQVLIQGSYLVTMVYWETCLAGMTVPA